MSSLCDSPLNIPGYAPVLVALISDNKNSVVGKRIIPEVPIPVADQKDRGLWERDDARTCALSGRCPFNCYRKLPDLC